MAVNSTRQILNTFIGDVSAQLINAAADNPSSPGEIENVVLSVGANTITPPVGAKACTILFPSGNIVLVTLKGVTGDTGVVLHPTDPTSIGLNAVTSFVLTAAVSTVTVRLIWS